MFYCWLVSSVIICQLFYNMYVLMNDCGLPHISQPTLLYKFFDKDSDLFKFPKQTKAISMQFFKNV